MNDKHEGLWVVRRIAPSDDPVWTGKFYLVGRGGWNADRGFALRFWHRDEAVRHIARELKAWPDQWGQIAPVRLIRKEAKS